MKKIFVTIANIVIICTVCITIVVYALLTNRKETKSALSSFELTTRTMANAANNFFDSSQKITNQWANYINSRFFTMNEALDYLNNIITEPDVSAQIIFTDSYEGKSTKPYITDAHEFSVSYAEYYDDICSTLTDFRLKGDPKSFHVTRLYTNQVDGEQVLAFYTTISLKSENGNPKDAYLLRLVTADSITNSLMFPSDYKEAEVALVTNTGRYIFKCNAFKSENFFEFLRFYNYSNGDNLEKLEKQQANFSESLYGTLQYKNAYKQESYFSFSRMSGNSDWMLICYIPVSVLNTYKIDWTIPIIITFAMVLLFIINFTYSYNVTYMLRKSITEAQKANSSKTEFLSTMSHDIRTPMNAIVGMTAIAARNLGNETKIKDCLKKISLASNHLLTLINDILDISKIETGRIVLNPVVFSLSETIDNVLNIVQPIIKEKNIDFAVQMHDVTKDYIFADQLRLNQIFINLLSNAVKYTDENGKVSLDLYEKDKSDKTISLIYCVRDTGVGMSKEFMEKMYKPFSREKDSRINEVEGSGLGLAITKKLADMMGGLIECKSQLGVGTTFTVSLTLSTAEKEDFVDTFTDEDTNQDNNFRGLTILIAEDYDLNWELISELLADYGITTERAINGKVCVEMVEMSPPGKYDMIFMDLQMPEMNGLEATIKIRQSRNSYINNIPIVAMTADAFAENVEECFKVGMNGHISKPINMDLVLKEIRKLCCGK